jgi:hypothetical protein
MGSMAERVKHAKQFLRKNGPSLACVIRDALDLTRGQANYLVRCGEFVHIEHCGWWPVDAKIPKYAQGERVVTVEEWK